MRPSSAVTGSAYGAVHEPAEMLRAACPAVLGPELAKVGANLFAVEFAGTFLPSDC